MWFEEFPGRPKEKIRFQEGDLVEELCGNDVTLKIVCHTPLTPEEMGEHKRRGSSEISHYGGDYYTLPIDDIDGHKILLPKNATDLFPLRFPVSDELRRDLEELYRKYKE